MIVEGEMIPLGPFGQGSRPGLPQIGEAEGDEFMRVSNWRNLISWSGCGLPRLDGIAATQRIRRRLPRHSCVGADISDWAVLLRLPVGQMPLHQGRECGSPAGGDRCGSSAACAGPSDCSQSD